jgi:hypothetical protein
MPDFGIFRGFNDKLFGNKLYAGQLPTQLGTIGSKSAILFTGILDLYPNAAAAYSLRRLNSLYTGNLIKVRRSSDNTEQDIGYLDNGDLNISALTSFCGSGNGFITTWYDQSGNSRNITQTTASNQPQIMSSGSIINLNSKPTVQFNNNQLLKRTSFSMNEMSLFTLLKKYTQNDYSGYMRNVTSSGKSFAITSYTPSAWWSQCVIFNNGSDTSPYVSRNTSKTLPTAQYIENWIFSNSRQEINENNTSISTITGQTGWSGNSDFSLGSINYAGNPTTVKIEIQEMIIYPQDEYNNKTGISGNINTYYGIY